MGTGALTLWCMRRRPETRTSWDRPRVFQPRIEFLRAGVYAGCWGLWWDVRNDAAVYQTSTGNSFAVGSSAGFFNVALNFAGPGSTPMPGDYDGDGETDPAVYHTSTGNWFVVGSS